MKIFVTGCSGIVGKIAAKGLSEAGAEVIGFARHLKTMTGVADFRTGNIADYDMLKAAMQDCDTVLHLAAYHMPYDAPEQEVFRVNAGGTFNIFKACAELGIKKLVVASSPNAIGYNFGVRIHELSYLPVDGIHPLYTTDPYSFTKQTIEEIGRYFYRRYNISSVFIRLGLDYHLTIENWVKSQARDDLRFLRTWVDGLLELPAKEGIREVRHIENEMNACRNHAISAALPFKNGTEYVYDVFSDKQKIWSYYIHNFLMYLDGRDLSDAVVCSFNASFEGSHDIFIADDKNMLGIESTKLAALVYPGVRIDFDRLHDYDALVDFRAAEKIVGFRAKHSVFDFYGELYNESGK
jgi:hypothetical protein